MTEQLGSTETTGLPESEIPEEILQELEELQELFFTLLRNLNSTSEKPSEDEINLLKDKFKKVTDSITFNGDPQMEELKNEVSNLFCNMLDAYYKRNSIARVDGIIRNSPIIEIGACVLAGLVTSNTHVLVQLAAITFFGFLAVFLPDISDFLSGIFSNNSGSDRPDDQSSQDPNSLDSIIRTIGYVDTTATPQQASILVENLSSFYEKLNPGNPLRGVLLKLIRITDVLSISAIAFDQSTPAHPTIHALKRLLVTLLISILVALGLRGCTAISDSQQLSSSQGARQTPAATVIINQNPNPIPPISITSPVSRPTATPQIPAAILTIDENPTEQPTLEQIFIGLRDIYDIDRGQFRSLIKNLDELIKLLMQSQSRFPEP